MRLSFIDNVIRDLVVVGEATTQADFEATLELRNDKAVKAVHGVVVKVDDHEWRRTFDGEVKDGKVVGHITGLDPETYYLVWLSVTNTGFPEAEGAEHTIYSSYRQFYARSGGEPKIFLDDVHPFEDDKYHMYAAGHTENVIEWEKREYTAIWEKRTTDSWRIVGYTEGTVKAEEGIVDFDCKFEEDGQYRVMIAEKSRQFFSSYKEFEIKPEETFHITKPEFTSPFYPEDFQAFGVIDKFISGSVFKDAYLAIGLKGEVPHVKLQVTEIAGTNLNLAHGTMEYQPGQTIVAQFELVYELGGETFQITGDSTEFEIPDHKEATPNVIVETVAVENNGDLAIVIGHADFAGPYQKAEAHWGKWDINGKWSSIDVTPATIDDNGKIRSEFPRDWFAGSTYGVMLFAKRESDPDFIKSQVWDWHVTDIDVSIDRLIAQGSMKEETKALVLAAYALKSAEANVDKAKFHLFHKESGKFERIADVEGEEYTGSWECVVLDDEKAPLTEGDTYAFFVDVHDAKNDMWVESKVYEFVYTIE